MNIFSLIAELAANTIAPETKQAFCLHVDQIDSLAEMQAQDYSEMTRAESAYDFGRYFAVLKEIKDNGVTLNYYRMCAMYGIEPWNIGFKFQLEAEEDESILKRGVELMTVSTYVAKRLTELQAIEYADDLPF